MKKKRCLLLFLFLLFSWYKTSFAIKPISKISALTGEALGIFINNNYAYVAHGEDGLVVINVANPESPYLEGVYDTDGEALDVVASGTYAFLADKVGLKILDVSNPNKITLVAEYKTNITNASSVYVEGKYAYLLDRNLGLFIIDISNPDSPTLTGNLYFRDGYDIYIKDNYAYIAAWSEVKIINIIDPGSPTIVSSCQTKGNAVSIFEKDNIIYVADHNKGIVLIDANNKNNLVATGSYTDISGLARCVYVVDNYAYIAASSGIYKINVATPTSPSLIGSITTECAYKLDIKDSYIYIADGKGGMKIYDSNLEKKGFYPTRYDLLYDVYIKGDYAYLAEGYTGLTVVDVSVPAIPKLLTKKEISYKAEVFLPGTTTIEFMNLKGRVVDIFVEGMYAYLAAEDAGLVIVNVENPQDPFILGYCPFAYTEENGIWYRYDIKAYAVYVEGDYAYLASHVWVYKWENDKWSFTKTVYPSIVIINIKNPSNPYVANIGSNLGQSPPKDVFFKDNYVFVSTHYNDGDKGLHVAYVSSPDSVILHKNILRNISPKPAYVDGIYIKGNYCYLACYTDGLYIIDITNPIKPVFMGKCDTPGRAYKVVVRGDYAYVADREGGVVIIDVRNPQNPLFVDRYCIEDVMSLNLKEGYVESYIYAVDKTGFFILDSEIYYLSGKVKDEKGGAIRDVLITIKGRDTKDRYIETSTTTTYDGSYKFLDLLKGLYEVKAEKKGFKFSPSKRKYEPLDTNKENQDFVGIPIYSIQGKITHEVTGGGVGGVLLTLEGDGQIRTCTTTLDGEYIFEDLLYGSYTLVPYKENYRFVPRQYLYQPLNEDKYWQDFMAVDLYDIVGTITRINNQGLGGVSLSLYKDNSLFSTTTTTSFGSYQFINIPYGTYTLIPEMINYGFNYGFNPPYYSFLLNEDKRFNFDAAVIYKISGSVSATATLSHIPGVRLELSGSSFAGDIETSTYTNDEGEYEFEVFEGGDYNIKATKEMWFFVPSSYTYTNISEDKPNTNFTGIKLLLIQGTITYQEEGLEGVEVGLYSDKDLIATYTTSYNGEYKFLNLHSGKDYKVIPKKYNWSFIPSSFTVSSLQANMEINFNASPTTTFSISGCIKDAIGSPLENIKINLIDKDNIIKASTNTNTSGSYTFSGLLPGFYYCVKLQDERYKFFPSDEYEFESINKDERIDFIAYKYLGIYGDIKDYFKDTPIKGVGVNLEGTNVFNETIQKNIYSGDKGEYIFSDLIKGTYTITPSNTNYIFYPISTQTVLVNEDKKIDFVGALLYSISGVVETSEGGGLGGVLITLSGSSRFPGMDNVVATTSTTINSGSYILKAVEGNYTLTPYNPNYIFSPPVREYKPLNKDNTSQNFTATPVFSIYGTVFEEGGKGIEGVKITLSNGTTTHTTYTDNKGSYSFSAVTPGTYTLSAQLLNYHFRSNPPMPVRLINEDIIVDFYATKTYSISGYVKDFGGNPLEDTEINLIKDNNIYKSYTTDIRGYYYFIGLERGSYTLKPQKVGYRFEPLKIDILLDEDKSGQNFTGWLHYKEIPEGEVRINYSGGGADKGYFNPQKGDKVRINYNTSKGGRVKVQIYTLSGQLIKKIEKDTQGGVDYIEWDGKNDAGEIVASGIYIIKIEALGFKSIKKICIMK